MEYVGKAATFVAVILLFISIVFFIPPDAAMAQPPPLFDNAPKQTPIDGGLGILAAIGGAYAIRKLRNRD